MRNKNLIKSMLCLLMGLACHVAWAQTPSLTLTDFNQESYPHALTEEQAVAVFAEEIAAIKYSSEEELDAYIVDMTTGTFAGSGNYSPSWTYTATEDNPAALTLSCGGINNMNSHEGLIQLHSGSVKSSTYTIAVPAGYTIVGYSFDYTFGNSGTGNKKFVVGDQEYPVTADKQTLTVEDVNAETTTFVLSGNNEPVKVSNFVVKVKAPTISELIEAKTTAKTEAEANANKLGEALGYYSYTANGGKLYTIDAVKDAIDAATTIAEITAIAESFALNVPEVGKYYRIKGISGNYIDAVNCYSGDQMGMKSDEACNYLGTIFLLDEGNRLKNVATDTYVHGTRHIGATKANANTWTFAASTRTLGCLTLTSNYSGSKELHDNSGNRADRCSSICGNRHDFTIEEVKAVTLTVDAPARVNASATWNGETKTLPATWIILEGTTADEPTLSVSCYDSYTFDGLFENEESLGNTVTIASLGANRTITAQFTPAFFSESYGDKWVRLSNCSQTSYWATVENTTANGNGKTAILDYADEKQLWCLVGNASSFVLYNKAAGKDLALKVTAATYGNGSQATLENDTQANWKLIEQDFGYALVPTHNTNDSNWGINMYGGAGGNLKLYGTAAENKGSYWMVELVDTDSPLTLNVEVDQVWESSPRVAELTLSINGANSQTRILGNVEDKKMYLPTGSTFTLSSMTYRGYTFNGFDGEDSYEDATLPEGGLEITASYTANEERTLFYSPSKTGKPYRIPAIATAPNGDIFAICDHRPCGGDIGNGDVDIVCRISSDNGVTWGDEIVLADGDGGSSNRMETGYGDPAIVVDRESNKILVMMVAGRTVCGNSRWDASKIGDKEASLVNRAARIYGTYNETKNEWEWTQPVEVTDDIYKLFLDENNNATVTSYFIGSGKICQSRVVKKGEYYRLYCALWTRDQGNRVLYSDDFGGTWNVLGTIADRPATGGNEPKCEELPDGTVLLSSRVPGGRYFNFFTFDNEGKSEKEMYTTGSWGTVAKSTETYDGSSQGTNGEIYKVEAIHKKTGRICDVMLQSVPAGPGGRYNVTVYYKEMDYTVDYSDTNAPATFATGWAVGKQVSEKYSAYSTMILQADNRIGFLFEEAPNECIIYIPYTLEDLTNGKYSLYVTKEDDDVGIEGTTSENQHATLTYDLMGRRVQDPTKGIYITDGKKVMIK